MCLRRAEDYAVAGSRRGLFDSVDEPGACRSSYIRDAGRSADDAVVARS